MLETPSIIKRPVLIDEQGQVHVGFKPEQYQALFG
jgi:arsenate reductase-like glutaredoxin family protein